MQSVCRFACACVPHRHADAMISQPLRSLERRRRTALSAYDDDDEKGSFVCVSVACVRVVGRPSRRCAVVVLFCCFVCRSVVFGLVWPWLGLRRQAEVVEMRVRRCKRKAYISLRR